MQALNAQAGNLFHLTDSKATRVVIYTQFPREFIRSEYHDKHLTVRRLALPARAEVLLAAAHLPSKLYATAGDQRARAARVAETIRRVERRAGHSRTILVGDLHMNPFEPGVIAADGLHAVMTKDLARKRERKIHEKSYPFFYNPMWGRFGDTTAGPPGTYYRVASSFTDYFWHMFDQVLIRPELLDAFDAQSLEVLTGCRGTPFLRGSGTPDANRVSDHLPLLFDLSI